MAKSLKKIINEETAPEIIKQNLKIFQRFLALIGKPFYLFLTYSIVFTLFATYSLGNFIYKFFTLVFKKLKKIRVKKISIKLPKISFPKITLPKIRIKVRSVFRKLGFFFLVLGFVFLFWFLILKDLPSPHDLTQREQEVSTKIYDRNGVLLYKIFKEKNRTPIPLSKVPNHVILATLAAEDAEFYLHPGFSIKGMARALVKNFKKGKLSGGSTITQQLVKNALLTPERTIIRKIKELILSVAVELIYSKDQILEMYLNEVSYGGTAYGIQEASRLYFGKDIKQLTLAEASLLVGLPKSPTKYSPFGSKPELALDRQKEILNLMVVNKYISLKESQMALEEKLVYAANRIDIKAPHFVMYVKQILAERYGEEVVETGGLEVATTLDYEIQEFAQKVVSEEILNLKGYNVGNGALLVINPSTGEVLAMVGSKDYFDMQNGGNFNVTTALRQPGSSIKVVNYAYALAHGYTAATILDDSPVSFAIPGSPVYSPNNYDGNYRGKIPLRSALAESRNVPAVKVLATYGVRKMIEQGQKMGITTWEDPSRFGLSLTLGGGEVKLIDLARVYATIANYGEKPEIISLLKVKNYKGKILESNENEVKRERVLDERIAFLLVDILKDNNARTPAFGPNSQLVVKDHPEVAVKTGTSNNLKDNLTIGFNQEHLVVVWVGNNDSSPMSHVASGVTGATPIFNKVMSFLLKEKDSLEWPVPENVENISICSLTGTLPCQGCPTKNEWFLKETKPQKNCIFKKPSEDKSKILEEGAKTEI